MFRRRRNDQNDLDATAEAADTAAVDDASEDASRDGAARATTADAGAWFDRSTGPFDEAETPDDGVTRLDLGGLRVPGADGMELRLELDETGEQVIAVTVVDAASTMQLMAFAAPRTDGIWDDVREEIRVSLAATGLVEVVEGEFGKELLATLMVAGPQGQSAMQPVRFVGLDGPRWFLRALFSGAASRDRTAAAGLEAVLRAVVVVRGGEAMAPGDQLALHVPDAIPEGMSRTAEAGRPPLGLPERGPEITEIH